MNSEKEKTAAKTAGSPKFHYGWVVFAACVIMIFVTLGFCSSVKSLFLAPVTSDTGLPRSLFSLADCTRYIVVAALNMVFGTMVLKLGARRMVAIGFLSLAVSQFLYSISSSVIVFCLGGAFLGLGLAFTTTTIIGYIVEKWFTNSKGTIMGFILAANGIGASVASQVLSPIIESSVSGWRNAYRTSAIIVLITGVVVVLLLREKPSDMGLEPLGKDREAKKKKEADWDGLDFDVLKKKSYFYVTLAVLFLYGIFVQSYSSCSSAHMRDVGVDAATIANVVSVSMILLFLTKTFSGFLCDKLGLRRVMFLCAVCATAAMVLLAFVKTPANAYTYCVFGALGLPLETVLMPLLAREMFGKKPYAHVMGILVGMIQLGSCIGMFFTNYIFDVVGTYKGVLLAYAAIMVVLIIVMDRMIVAARKDRTAA